MTGGPASPNGSKNDKWTRMGNSNLHCPRVIEEFGLFENLNRQLLLKPDHEKLYEPE